MADNADKLARCNIPAWHTAGYRGQGIKIAVFEDTSKGHGRSVADVLQQLAPEAEVLARQRPGPIERSGGKLKPDTYQRLAAFYRGLVDEGAHLVAMSLGGTGTKDMEQLEHELLISQGLVLFTSAGNEGREIIASTAAALSSWIAVGACALTASGPRRTDYSNYGPKLACMGFTNLYLTTGGNFAGTSAANPWVTGLIALWAGWHLQHYGRTPNQTETLEFIRQNSDRLGPGDRDDLHGYGLLRLPEPSSLTVPEPQPPKEDKPMFNDINGHWAEADIEKAAEAGLLTGYPDGRFDPNGPVTRAQLAAVLNRVLAKVGK